MSESKWEEWRPPFAKHVLGRYTERTFDLTGAPNEQLYEIICEHCKDRYGPLKCTSGAVREHISRFGILHLHRNPLG